MASGSASEAQSSEGLGYLRRHDPTHRQWADLIGTGQPWAWAKATLSRPRGRAVSISSPVSPGVRTVPAREAGKSTWRWAIARLTLSSDILPTPPQASAGDPSRFPRSAQPSYRLRTSPSLQSPCTDHILSPTTAYDDRPRIANSSYDPKTYTPLAHRPPQSAPSPHPGLLLSTSSSSDPASQLPVFSAAIVFLCFCCFFVVCHTEARAPCCQLGCPPCRCKPPMSLPSHTSALPHPAPSSSLLS